MNVASEVRNVETSPERNLPCRILCRRDGEYESVIVILLDSSPEQISVFNNNMLARAPIYHERNIFTVAFCRQTREWKVRVIKVFVCRKN